MITQKTEKEENSVFVGNKPFMNYVTSVAIQFNKGANSVIIKSRGKFISKGVDVAEVARRKFLSDKNVSVSKTKVGSEEFQSKEGKTVNVSFIEITLTKN